MTDLKLYRYPGDSKARRVMYRGHRLGTVVMVRGWWRPTWNTALSRGCALLQRYLFTPLDAAEVLVREHERARRRIERKGI